MCEGWGGGGGEGGQHLPQNVTVMVFETAASRSMQSSGDLSGKIGTAPCPGNHWDLMFLQLRRLGHTMAHTIMAEYDLNAGYRTDPMPPRREKILKKIII